MYFIKGGYIDIKKALEDRGWIEQEDEESVFFDLKWTCKCKEINHQ